MRKALWLVLLLFLQGCASVAQQNAEGQYGLYKERLFRVKVIGVDEDAPGFLFWRDRAARAKAALQKSAELQGLRYEDFVNPGWRVASVLASESFALNKGDSFWAVQYDPARMQLERGDVVTAHITPAMFEFAIRDLLKPGDVPEVMSLVCKQTDAACLADPRRGGTLGVILEDGTAINGSSQFFGIRFESDARH